MNEPGLSDYQGSAWYQQIEFEIENLKLTSDEKHVKKFQLDLLKRIARRMDEFSQTCSECEDIKAGVNDLLREVPMLLQFSRKEDFKRYKQTMTSLSEHLKKAHGLVHSGMYMGVGITIGSGLGTALSAALDNYAFMGIGIGIGVAIGAALDARAKQAGKVL